MCKISEVFGVFGLPLKYDIRRKMTSEYTDLDGGIGAQTGYLL